MKSSKEKRGRKLDIEEERGREGGLFLRKEEKETERYINTESVRESNIAHDMGYRIRSCFFLITIE